MTHCLLVTYAPVAAAEDVRKALAEAGAGNLGNYDSCSWSAKGTGRFRPLKGSKPTIGSEGSLEEVAEERIEVVIPKKKLDAAIAAVRKVHPYEEPAIYAVELVFP